MRLNKLLTLFAATLMLWGGQSAYADVTYTALSATKFNNNEGAEKLLDGQGSTKWGESLSTGNPRWLIFKTNKAINASQYTLTVANDTPGNKGRQWTKWKIYGANFYADGMATKDATGWVLIDQKNCPTDTEFPIGSGNNSYQKTDFTMSENNSGYYQYFKIVVEEIRSSGQYGQMGDFCFKTFNEKTEAETYATKVTLAKASTFDPQTLGTSYPLFTEFQDLTTGSTLDTYLENAGGDYASLEGKLVEVYELQRVMKAYIDGRNFSAITGSGGCWGDGHYDNLVDGNNNTKWGGNFPGSGEKVMWMIFRAKESIKPFFYKLLTAWDAQSWAGRNWKDWTIKGGNFATMDAAQRSAEGWIMIDSRTNVGQDLLPAKNGHLAPFGVNGTFTDEYDYFLVEVTNCFNNGTQIQMNELILGTEEEFNKTKADYMTELNAYVVPDIASAQQKQDYADAKTAVQNATPENILEKYNAAKAIQSDIFVSLKDDKGFYQITSPVDLEIFSDLVNAGEKDGEPNAKGKLTQDINLTGFKLTQIGGVSSFTGEFDGQGHTISHLTDNNAAGWRSGLFGLTDGATIADIIFEDAEIYGRYNMSVAVGEATNTTIKNILVRNCKVETVNGGDRLGGIAGQISGGTIQNCAVINSSLKGENYTGAIVGNAIAGAIVKNCYSNTDVYAQGSYAGGVAGAVQTATIEKNFYTGSIRSDHETAAGLVGIFNVQKDNDYALVLRKNMVAASTVTAPSTRTLINVPAFPEGQSTEPTYSGNYLLNSTVYSDNDKVVDHENDVNGKQLSLRDATCKSFYAETLGWDMENDWKFVAAGQFPVLAWMEAFAAAPQTITVTAAGYATAVAKNELDFTGSEAKAYIAQVVDNKYVHLEPITIVPAGEPFIVKAAAGSYQIPAAVENGDATGNDLKASDTDIAANGSQYVLAQPEGQEVGFYQAVTGTIAAGKAFIALDGTGPLVKALYFEGEDATGISGLNDVNCLNDAVIYNVAGQKLSKLQKGINIVGGKKVLK